MTELKPCPFCGCEVSEIARYGRNGWFLFIQCDVCGAESKKIGIGKYADVPSGENEFWECEKVQRAATKAKAAWNMRHVQGGSYEDA